MKFWGASIAAGKTKKVEIPENSTLRVTQVALGEQVVDGRSVLSVATGGQKFVIASLIPEKCEHAVLELMFEEGTIEFSVTGKNAVHLAGNMMQDMDEDDFDDEDRDMGSDEEDDDDEPVPAKGAAKGKPVQAGKPQAAKKGQAQDEDEDDDDDNDDEEGPDGMDEDDEDDDEGGEDEEGDDDDDEDEAPQSKKRAAPAPSKGAPPAKQQKGGKQEPPKAGKEGGAKPKAAEPPKTPKSPAPSAAGAATTPTSSKKEVPADVKAKIKQILAGQAAGVKGADFPREWQKAHGSPFKDAFAKLGFKKQGEFMSALNDIVEAKGSGSEVTFFAKKK